MESPFTPGQTRRIVTVTVKGDAVDELDETFTLNLSAPTNAALGDTQATATILDNDVPAVSVADPGPITEPATGSNAVVQFVVTLNGPAASEVTVNYATSNGTAISGFDYIRRSGTVIFAPGQTRRVVTVTIKGDAVVETDETFTLNLTAPTNAKLADPQATATIIGTA